MTRFLYYTELTPEEDYERVKRVRDIMHEFTAEHAYSYGIFGTCMLSSFLADVMVVFVYGVHPPHVNEQEAIFGVGKTFEEAVLDAEPKVREDIARRAAERAAQTH